MVLLPGRNQRLGVTHAFQNSSPGAAFSLRLKLLNTELTQIDLLKPALFVTYCGGAIPESRGISG
jgi:hypothetical protein